MSEQNELSSLPEQDEANEAGRSFLNSMRSFKNDTLQYFQDSPRIVQILSLMTGTIGVATGVVFKSPVIMSLGGLNVAIAVALEAKMPTLRSVKNKKPDEDK